MTVRHITVLWDDDYLEEFEDVAGVGYLPTNEKQEFLQIQNSHGNLINLNLNYIKKIKFYNETTQ